MRRTRRVNKPSNYAENSSSDEDHKPKKKAPCLEEPACVSDSKKHSRLDLSEDDDFVQSPSKKKFARSFQSSDDEDYEETQTSDDEDDEEIQTSDDDFEEQQTFSESDKPKLSRLKTTKGNTSKGKFARLKSTKKYADNSKVTNLKSSKEDINDSKVECSQSFKKNAKRPSQSSKTDDSSSSESDIENYLKRPEELNLNSMFFKSDKSVKAPTFSQIEKNIFENVKQLSDSESDSEDEDLDKDAKNEKPVGVEKIKKDAPKATFEQLAEFTKKIEEAKMHVEKYKAKKRQEKKKEDINELLTMGEKNAWSSPEMIKGVNSALSEPSFRSSEFESFSDSEKEDWEEVEQTEQPPKPNIIPKDGVEITVKMPDTIRKKKGIDLVAAMKRRLNRIKKENQVYIHRVHLLCWIAHGNYINNVLNKESLLAVALSLLPSQQCYPPDRTDLKYLEGIVGWFRRTITNVEKKTPKNMALDKYLMVQLNKKQAHNSKMYVYMFVCILRALGIQCRLVMSVEVEPLRPPASELHSVSTKTNGDDKKSEGIDKKPKAPVKKKSTKSKKGDELNVTVEEKEIMHKQSGKNISEMEASRKKNEVDSKKVDKKSKKPNENKEINSDKAEKKSSIRGKRKIMEKDDEPKKKISKRKNATTQLEEKVESKPHKGKPLAKESKELNIDEDDMNKRTRVTRNAKKLDKDNKSGNETGNTKSKTVNTKKLDKTEKSENVHFEITHPNKTKDNSSENNDSQENANGKVNKLKNDIEVIKFYNLSENSNTSSEVEAIINKDCRKQVRVIIHKLTEEKEIDSTQKECNANNQTKLRSNNKRTRNIIESDDNPKKSSETIKDNDQDETKEFSKETKRPVKITRKKNDHTLNKASSNLNEDNTRVENETSPGMRLRYPLLKIEKNLNDHIAKLENLEKVKTISKNPGVTEDSEKIQMRVKVENSEKMKTVLPKIETNNDLEDTETSLKSPQQTRNSKKVDGLENIETTEDSGKGETTLKVPHMIDDLEMSRGSWRRSKSHSPIGLKRNTGNEPAESLEKSISSTNLDEEKVEVVGVKTKKENVGTKEVVKKGRTRKCFFKIPIKQKNKSSDVPQVDGVEDYSSDDYYSDESNCLTLEIPQLDGNEDDDAGPSTSKQPLQKLGETKRKNLSRIKIQPVYKDVDSEEDFSPRSPFTNKNQNVPKVNLTRLKDSQIKSAKDGKLNTAKESQINLSRTRVNLRKLNSSKESQIHSSKLNSRKQSSSNQSPGKSPKLRVNLEKLSPKQTMDVRNDIVSLVKGRINEEKHKDKSRLVKNKKLKLDEDSDSDYAPMPVIKKKQSPNVSKVKVKRRIPPRSALERKVFSSDEEASSSPTKNKKKGVDIWVEVFLESEEKWISADVIKGQVHCVKEIFSRASHPISYILAWDNTNRVKDVSKRYCSNWNTVTRKLRTDEKWWEQSLAPFIGKKNARDKEEDADLARLQLDQPLPKSIAEYKDHPLYVLPRHLLKFQAIYPPDAITLGFIRNEPVYSRDCVYTLHSREIWLKEAKVVKPGEKPYKIVKARPKWDKSSNSLIKDQLLEIFGKWQIEDYVPPTAENGIVPRNAYGNVELFKECMLPKGTLHLQLPGLNKVAKKLRIDCAPAVIGFDFHSGFSHPTFDGFVVCEEFGDKLIAAWYQEQEDQEKREKEKYEKRVYGNWKRLIKGLLIRKRLKARYDFSGELTVPIPKPPEKPEGKPKAPRFIINKKKK